MCKLQQMLENETIFYISPEPYIQYMVLQVPGALQWDSEAGNELLNPNEASLVKSRS